jgi:hypothetical protein
MADEREEKEGEPKIRIVDRRMLSEEEREGTATVSEEPQAAEVPSERPKLEVIGGGAPKAAAAPRVTLNTAATADEETGDEAELEEEEPLSEEEQEQLREEIEQQHFAEYEKQLGRPLTAQEKARVREEMERQARAMASLEISPILQQLMAELSGRAAIHMGLMPNPYTRLIARNDNEARLAIDAFSALFDVLKPQLDAGMQREFARVLNDLRVNFVSITGGQPSGPSRIIH